LFGIEVQKAIQPPVSQLRGGVIGKLQGAATRQHPARAQGHTQAVGDNSQSNKGMEHGSN
jgi:hypothetical protein